MSGRSRSARTPATMPVTWAITAATVWLLAGSGCSPPPYREDVGDLSGPFAAYYEGKLALSRAAGVRPGNEERLVRRSPERTDVAVLYIHGWGATRAEGEAIFDTIGERLGANTYYLRLPGHGTDMDDQAAQPFTAYLDCVSAAFLRSRQLGRRIIVGGTSTGALLATWLAARYPMDTAALIIASPLYEFRGASARLLGVPGVLPLAAALSGGVRDAGWRAGEDVERKLPGFEDHWLTAQRYSALHHLENLRRYIARAETFARVSAPALLFYYYRDEEHQDEVVSVAAMREAFALFGTGAGRRAPQREVAVADGNHVLFSAYVRTDKALILRETMGFLEGLADVRLDMSGPSTMDKSIH
ncbi:MAG: alpha/beta hydrolase [Candidatus Schekmanbacteria bacterium]|nr:alpha/beta hydrolase [Candidatus Schekmanbacteria bacterium]